jgi:two-component system, OmpR family, sensor histidine kinase KdpD
MWIPFDFRREAAGSRRQSLDAGTAEAHTPRMARTTAIDRSIALQLRNYAAALLMVGAATVLGLVISPRWGNSAIDLLYLPAVLGAAVVGGLWTALLAAVLSALAYNFFFTAPHMTFRIDNPNDVVTVLVLFAVAAVTSQLAASIREQARIAEAHAARNATIAGFARRLLSCTNEQEIADVSTRELGTIFECNAVLISNDQEPQVLASAPVAMRLTLTDVATAALTLSTGERSGRGLDRAVPTEWQFHPVKAGTSVLAAMAIARDDGSPPVRPDQLALVDNLLDQVALALERTRLEGEAREFARLRERDQFRSTLLATIGEDFAPALSTISEAVRGLRRNGAADKGLVSAIGSETSKLERYLSNLADLGMDDERAPIRAGPVTIDLFQRSVSRDGDTVHLTPKEYAVLAELAKHPGRVLTHAHLLRTAWGPAQENQTEYLRVAVRGLRQKLERDPSRPEIILNEPAVGYRLQPGS